MSAPTPPATGKQARATFANPPTSRPLVRQAGYRLFPNADRSTLVLGSGLLLIGVNAMTEEAEYMQALWKAITGGGVDAKLASSEQGFWGRIAFELAGVVALSLLAGFGDESGIAVVAVLVMAGIWLLWLYKHVAGVVPATQHTKQGSKQ